MTDHVEPPEVAAWNEATRSWLYHDTNTAVQDGALLLHAGLRLVTALRRTEAERDAALRERDRFREHSMTLNTVSWRISQALGNVPEGATEVWGDTLPNLEALIRDRDEYEPKP